MTLRPLAGISSHRQRWSAGAAGLLLTLMAGCGPGIVPPPYRDAGHGDGDGGFCARCVDGSDCAAGACDEQEGRCQSCKDDTFLQSDCHPSADVCQADDPLPPWLDCSDTWDNFADTFIELHCRGCHRDFPAASDVVSARILIETGRMPRGEALSFNDKRRIVMWLECGAK